MSSEPAPRNQTSLRLEIAQEGDLRSFVQLVHPVQDKLFAYAFLMTASVHDADDCMQRGLKYAREHLMEIGNLSVERFFLRHVRRYTLELLASKPFDAQGIASNEARSFVQDALTREDHDAAAAILLPILQRLSTEERDAFVLTVVLDIGVDGVGAVAGVEERVSTARARRALRELEATGCVYSDPGSAEVPDSNDLAVLVTSFWRDAGEALLKSSPRPVRTIDEMLSQPVGKRAATQASRHQRTAVLTGKRGRKWAWIAFAALFFALGGVVTHALLPGATPRSTHQVRFVFADESAAAVAVVGDFNDWDMERTPLVHRVASGLWEVWVSVPEGRHRYMFVVDGEQRIVDPLSAEIVPDGRGGKVSVLHVPAAVVN